MGKKRARVSRYFETPSRYRFQFTVLFVYGLGLLGNLDQTLGAEAGVGEGEIQTVFHVCTGGVFGDINAYNEGISAGNVDVFQCGICSNCAVSGIE